MKPKYRRNALHSERAENGGKETIKITSVSSFAKAVTDLNILNGARRSLTVAKRQ